MKNVLFAMAALTTLVACQAPRQALPVNPINAQNLRAMSTQSKHHPDFARKLQQGRNYRFSSDTAVSSICGPNNLQQVNSYDGSLGQPVEFVNKFKPAVGALAQGKPDSTSRKFCSGTLIGEDLFLTAAHCVDAAITQKFAVFNYETAKGSSTLLEQEHFKVAAIVEDGNKGLDYAVLRLEGKPGLKYGFTGVRAALPEQGHLLSIIQHPKGQPKQVEVGPMAGIDDEYMLYSDLDTEPGSSGSGVLDQDGMLVAVHTNGGCHSGGGANRGVKMTDIVAASPALQALNQSRLRR